VIKAAQRGQDAPHLARVEHRDALAETGKVGHIVRGGELRRRGEVDGGASAQRLGKLRRLGQAERVSLGEVEIVTDHDQAA
jgi:hypothetical protein